MTHLIVCTHSRHDLCAAAIASVRKNATDDLRVTVLDSSLSLAAMDGAHVVPVDCPQYRHAFVARGFSAADELTVCIDDDVRLVARVNLAERYTAGWYKHLNGHMVQAWTDPDALTPYTRLSQWRVASGCPRWPATLCELAAAAGSEQVDGIWLHIDKGSLAPTPERDALIRYVDCGPGLGDMVADGLAAIGVTKAMAQKAASIVGIKDCGCSGRQAALNSVGRRLGIGGPEK